MRTPGQIDALTSLRFFLALFVLVGHFVGHSPEVLTPQTGFVFNFGPVAVSWFFILSGFVIAYNYPKLDDGPSRHAFIIARFARLWPVHIITTLGMVYLEGGAKYYPFFLTMTHTWTASPDMSMSYNSPSWSISDELFFYVCYVGLVSPKKWLRWAVIVVPIACSITLLTALHCDVAAGSPRQCSALLPFWPPTRLPEFLAGVAICRLRLSVHPLVGVGLAAAFVLNFFPPLPRPPGNLIADQFAWQLTSILCGGALIASLSHDSVVSRLLSIWPLILGGEISYSMYMTHQVVNIAILDRVLPLGFAAAFSISLATTICISAAMFFFVESPTRSAVKRWLRRPISTPAKVALDLR